MRQTTYWDAIVVDALAPSRLSADSFGNPGFVAVDAEKRTNDKYKVLVEKG